MSDSKTVWQNNSKKPASYTNTNSSSNLVRLVEDKEIGKSIEFDELSIAEYGLTVDRSGAGPVFEDEGAQYPVIRINDAYIAQADIKSMTISCDSFVPEITLNLSFASTEFVTRHIPKDGDMISTFICVNTAAMNYFRNDFIVTSCSSSIASGKSSNKVTITGRMFIPKFDSIQNEFGVIGTSKDVAKEVAKKFKLGFSYNDEEDTEDFQDWICCKQTIPDFMQHVIDHSWKNGKTFFNAWVDLYYDLCFVNVNKFLLSSENTEEEIDITFRTATSRLGDAIHDRYKDQPPETLKIFSNDIAFKGTPFYISKWRPYNDSTSVSIDVGYESDSYVFVHNSKVYEENSDKCFDISENFPFYDESKLNDHIILRGRGKWTEANPEDDRKRVNYDEYTGEKYTKTYKNTDWAGIEYTMSDDDKDIKDNTQWSGNVHKNYGHAYYHNRINKAELDKIYIEIECNGLCVQVMRGERIPVYIIYENKLENQLNNDEKNDDVLSMTNKFWSGFYIIDSLYYEYKQKNGAFSNYTTRMILKRREWPTPEPVQEELYAKNEDDDFISGTNKEATDLVNQFLGTTTQ